MTPEQGKKIELHEVLQIVENSERAKIGAFVSVIEVNSWGCRALLKTDGVAAQPQSLTWQQVETTGGFAVIDNAGNRIGEAKPAVKHHP